MPSAKLEYDRAKIRIVRIRLIDVRGITLAGRCVSWAACEIDSSPTNEMIASETPFIRLKGVGHAVLIVWASSSGWKAKRNW